MTVGPDAFADVMQELGGSNGERAWRALLKGSEPVVDAAMACPPMALRADPLGFVQTALVPYLLPAIFKASLKAKAFIPDLLTGASSQLFDLGDEAATTFRKVDRLSGVRAIGPARRRHGRRRRGLHAGRPAPPERRPRLPCGRFRRRLRGPRGLHQ